MVCVCTKSEFTLCVDSVVYGYEFSCCASCAVSNGENPKAYGSANAEFGCVDAALG